MTNEQLLKAYKSAEGMRVAWKMGDNLRDAGRKQPESVVRMDNILYGPYGRWNLFDIYYPLEALSEAKENAKTVVQATTSEGELREFAIEKEIPFIVNIHGGGWQYGDKELYQYYGMALASRGFAVVNFTYRLAPEDELPAAYIDINRMLTFLADNADKFGLDANNMFFVGDSAGGQMASLFGTLMSNASYRALYAEKFPKVMEGLRKAAISFSKEEYCAMWIPKERVDLIPDQNMELDESYSFIVPADRLILRAVALNCGCYNMPAMIEGGKDEAFSTSLSGLLEKDRETALSLVDSWGYQDSNFPPAFVMSAPYDFLLPMAGPMVEHLKSVGAEAELHVYGTEEQKYLAHVFHVNEKLAEARQCNDEECAFFKAHLG